MARISIVSNQSKALLLRNNYIERVEQLLFDALDVFFRHLSKEIRGIRVRRVDGAEAREDGHHRDAKHADSGDDRLDQAGNLERKRRTKAPEYPEPNHQAADGYRTSITEEERVNIAQKVEYRIRNDNHTLEENQKQVYFPVKFPRVAI